MNFDKFLRLLSILLPVGMFLLTYFMLGYRSTNKIELVLGSLAMATLTYGLMFFAICCRKYGK